MKIKKGIFIVIHVASLLFFPASVLAADWGGGITIDGSGNLGVAVGVGSGNYYGGGWALANPYGLPQGSILGIVSNLLFWLLAIFSIMGIVGFVIAGIMYLVSAGDDDMINKAKSAMKWSIVGIIVGLSGFLIMQAVSALLSGGSKNF